MKSWRPSLNRYAMIPRNSKACGKTFIICNNCAAFTGGTTLRGWKLKHPARPNVPTFCPLYSVPMAQAASSMIFNSQLFRKVFYFFDLRWLSELVHNYNRFVFLVITRSISSGSIQRSASDTSARTALAPQRSTTLAVAGKVNAGHITSSSGTYIHYQKRKV